MIGTGFMTYVHADTLGDFVQPFQIEAPGLRGRLVRLGPELRTALAPHHHPSVVAGLLGETVALALVLSSGLKFDGVFTLQANGDGPVGTLMADVTTAGNFRCYARYDADRLPPDAARGGVPLPRLLGAGHLAFTVDQGGEHERYQGITDLDGGTLAECVHHYFRQSEQLQTAVMAAAGDGEQARAGALMLQQLPKQAEQVDADEDWRRAVILMSSLSTAELLDEDVPSAGLLYRLFHEDGVRLYEPSPVHNVCRCSERKVRSTLQALPRREVEDMAEPDGRVVVTCEFCKTDYVYQPADLDAVYAEAEGPETGG